MKFTVKMSEKGYTKLKKSVLLTLFLVIIASFAYFAISVFAGYTPIEEVKAMASEWGQYNNIIMENNTTSGVYWYVNWTLGPKPYNGSTHYEGTNVSLNISLNSSFEYCKFSIDENGTFFDMNLSGEITTNRSFINGTGVNFTTFPQLQTSGWHNVTYYCNNNSGLQGGAGNETWTNGSLIRFRFKASDYDITILSPLNGTTYKGPNVNVTLNTSARRCWLKLTDRTTQWNLTMEGNNRSLWYNSTAIDYGNDTAYGKWLNMTVWCEDAIGTRSFYNNTLATVATDWKKIKIDNSAPILSSIKWSFLNDSGGNIVNMTLRVQDNSSYPSVLVRAYYHYNATNDDGAVIDTRNIDNFSSYIVQNWSVSGSDIGNESRAVYINISSEDVTRDGLAVLQIEAWDDVDNLAKGVTNLTVQFRRLKTGWNYYVDFYNATLLELAGHVPNITYAAVFNNVMSNKSWQTFTTGGSTRSGLVSNFTNVTALYLTQDNLLIRNATRGYEANMRGNEIVDLYHNSSTKSGWNLYPVYIPTTLNKTLWNPGVNNLSSGFAINETMNFTLNWTWNKTVNYKIINITNFTNHTHSFNLIEGSTPGNYSWMTNSTRSYIRIFGNATQGVASHMNLTQDYNVSYTWASNYVYSDYSRNLTWACVYDAQLGRFCCAHRSRRATTCDGYISENYTIPKGSAVWLNLPVPVNFTSNASKVYTVDDHR